MAASRVPRHPIPILRLPRSRVRRGARLARAIVDDASRAQPPRSVAVAWRAWPRDFGRCGHDRRVSAAPALILARLVLDCSPLFPI
jgi:hypothetical protein